MIRYDLYINGNWQKPSSGNYFESDNPYSGEVWAEIAKGNEEDVNLAVIAAKNAFEEHWEPMKPTERGKILVRLAELIERDAVRLGEIEVKDNGKLFAEMGAQTKYLAEWYRYFGGLADKVEGAVIPIDKPGMLNYTKYEPFGVVGLITPWNSPLLLLAWKLAPALAAGNTAVIKPSEFTSASTLEFMRLAEEAGFPSGVINCVTGFGLEVGQPLVDHKDVSKIAFTGSDISGQKIYESAAKKIMPVTLELGGKSPNIVFNDADMDAAVMGVISGIFAATGQTCIAGSRLLLHEDIHDEFVSKLVSIAQEEVFGPVLSIIRFKDEKEAIKIGNDILFGLAAGVWTSDIGRALRMADKLKAGTVWVNTYRAVSFMSPFGGYKRSGQGRESGQECIKEFLETKSVWISHETSTANPFIIK